MEFFYPYTHPQVGSSPLWSEGLRCSKEWKDIDKVGGSGLQVYTVFYLNTQESQGDIFIFVNSST